MNTVDVECVENRILTSLRRIMRAVDIYSRRINREFKLTTPQLICLQAVVRSKRKLTQSQLTSEVNLSASTVVGIIDRLEAKELIRRERSTNDRRNVFIMPTDRGMQVAAESPPLLQDKLSRSLGKLPVDEQNQIAESLKRVVEMMEVEDVEAVPNLIPSPPLDI